MDERMEEAECVFEDSLEIDFDYEFDVAKFFDFLRPESAEEIEEAERWFHLASGYPPSPLLIKLNLGVYCGESDTSSPRYDNQYAYSTSDDCGSSDVSSVGQGKKVPQLLRSKSCLSTSSRLLQPTASHLAKQNIQTGHRGTRAPERLQKIGSPPKSPGDIAATKRQKLEVGYLRKVAHLKHQTSFSHKPTKKVESYSMNSSRSKQKVTVPKEPDLKTANRAQRHRSRNAAELENESNNISAFRTRLASRKIFEPREKTTPASVTGFQRVSARNGKAAGQSGMLDHKRLNATIASEQENPDEVYRFKARPLNKKILSSRGDIGVLRKYKRSATIPKEFKFSSSKKYGQNPPVELFSKLTLNSERHPGSMLEVDPSLQTKGSNKNGPTSMKENKNENTTTRKLSRCCSKQSERAGGRMITDMRSHVTSARILTIH